MLLSHVLTIPVILEWTFICDCKGYDSDLKGNKRWPILTENMNDLHFSDG